MVTEEAKTEKLCAFCANDFHLEMILLPFIKERINSTNFIILTENNLDKSVNTLLEKINLDVEIKEKIKNIGWNNNNNEKIKEILGNKNQNLDIIINGTISFINLTKSRIKNAINDNINIIDCYHIEDKDINIKEIRANYKYILNTQRIV